jgi:hypothetical protein
MTHLRYIFLLQFATTVALGQLVHPSESPTKATKQSEAVVRSLYREVVGRHPTGIPGDADMQALAPYLSKGLIRTIDSARACSVDWNRQHPRPDEKPEFAWFETGLFSGGNEKASPRAFHVERTQPEKDGLYRVFVRLTGGVPEDPLIWHVAALVVRGNGRFVVDDVIYLKDETRDVESRLSEALTLGCDGSRWVGYGEQRGHVK